MSEEATLDEFTQGKGSDGQRQDWKTVKLSDIASKRSDNVDPQEVELEKHVGLEHIDPNNPTPDWEPVDGLSSTKRRFEPGDILFGKLRPNLEKSAQPDFEGVSSTDIFPVVAKADINSKWLLYRLSSKPAYDYARRTSAGTRMPRTSWNLFSNFDFGLPPLPEQRKIATVLHTVDRAIEKAGSISEQIGKVERGLQQALFSGKHLDCDQREVPTMNTIPKHWNVNPMGEVCDITMGSSPKSEHYNESGDGLPFFQANNEFGLRTPRHDRWCSNPVKTANSGDSLMTLRGTYVGQMNIADRECCIGRGLAGISAGDDLLEEYLYQHLRRRERYVKSIAIGSTFDSVSSDDLENLPIAIPPKEEQKQIADTLHSVQERLKFTDEYITELTRLKRGLMQDLLSGTVRTTDTTIEVPDDIAQYG